MRYRDSLYEAFLEEMHELEDFRISHATEHPGVPLDRDDPDVRRLVEALAFFSARSHVAGLRNIASSHRRIFQQFFPYLMSPLPSMAMIQALPKGQLADTIELPYGTELAITAEGERTAIFRTLCDLRIMPLRLRQARMLPLPGAGFRLALTFVTPFARSEDIGTISLHINHLNDYQASLRLIYLLRKHIRRSFVVFNEKVNETTKGTTCSLSYGRPISQEDEEWEHPIHDERTFFHFPQQELFMNVKVPAPPRNWEQFTICLDLDRNWPHNTTVNETMFQLFAVPITNMTRSMANPVLCDGLAWRHSIKHPNSEGHYALHNVKGVYRARAGSMVPIRAGILAGNQGTFEVERERTKDGKMKGYLELHFPTAFEEAFTVAIDATWYQPWFSEALGQRINITPYRRTVSGVGWDIVSSFVPHVESPFEENMDAFLHLFTLRSKARLHLEDIMSLLNVMGTVWSSHFRRLQSLIEGLRVEEVPLNKASASGMMKHVYTITLKEFDPILEPLVAEFVRHLALILEAWLAGATVEVRIDGPGASSLAVG